MSRRTKRPSQKRGAGESLMDFYLRSRVSTDVAIDRDLERSCTSKQQYASDAEARAIAAMNGMSGSLYTYHCRYCEFWHLTRRPNFGEHPQIIDE